MDKRYQLIHPYLSNHIYEAPTLSLCAKQCCDDIEKNFSKEGLSTVNSFTLKDIDTKEVFTFNMKIPLSKTLYQPPDDLILMGDIENNEIAHLKAKISKLETDINKIKQYLILEKQKHVQPLPQQKTNECTIQ